MLQKFLPKSSYARNVITLMTGTGLAQALPIAVSPILTRLYTPDEFGKFALYMAVVSIVSVLVTGRYELAILLPKRDRDAFQIVALSVALSTAISAALFVLVALLNQPMARILGLPEMAPWLYWVPASTLLMGVYQSLNYWCNRKGQYKRLAISRTVQSGSASLAQLGGGYAGIGAFGLMGGQLIGQLLATTVIARIVGREDRGIVRTIRKNRMFALARRYANFPKYLIVAHGFNTASGQMPVILLGSFFGATTVGFYTLTQRVLSAPLLLIAGALGDVFRQEASTHYIHNRNCKQIYVKTFQRLALIAFIPFVGFFFLAPSLFSLVFGAQWRIAGVYAQILTPMFYLQFITSPLSSMYMIAEKQRFDLFWQIILFTLVASAFFIGNFLTSTKIALLLFSCAYSLMYAINGLISYQLALGRWSEK